MIYGYARVSTEDQHLEPQLAELQAAGCQDIRREKAGGADRDRPELGRLMAEVRRGDVLVVCKLDRIARSTAHLLALVERLDELGVAFRVLNCHIDTGTPTGKLMLTMLGAIATFEREMMLERQRDGIRAAQAAGRYKGRDPVARRQSAAVLVSLAAGVRVEDAALAHGISVASVYRIKRAADTAAAAHREPGVWTDVPLPGVA